MRERAPWPIAAWGVGGVLLILGVSVVRLAERAAHLEVSELGPVHWVFGIVWLAFMVYAEAWRGFHKQFSPRVVERALFLPTHPLLVLAAPAVCMGLIHATRKRLIVSRSLVVGIVVLVLIVRQVPAPWREIVDLGVTAGLGGGTLSVVWFAARAALGTTPGVPTDYPEG